MTLFRPSAAWIVSSSVGIITLCFQKSGLDKGALRNKHSCLLALWVGVWLPFVGVIPSHWTP